MATKKKSVKAAVKKASPAAKKPASAKKKAAVKKSVPAKKAAAKPAPKKAAKSTKKPVAAKKKIVKTVTKPKSTIKPKAQTPKKVQKNTPKKEVPKKTPTKVSKPVPEKVSQASLKPKDIKVPPAKPVVVPQIRTKTSRKYQPDFTKSVLDQPANDPGAPIVRYSDADLNEFRELILRKLESAKKELSYLQGLITRKDEMGGDEGDNRYMTMEDGSLSMEREQLSQMASRQITFIDHLEKALMRIENKTYGICRVTGRLIDKARLRAVPHATLSIEAKMNSSK